MLRYSYTIWFFRKDAKMRAEDFETALIELGTFTTVRCDVPTCSDMYSFVAASTHYIFFDEARAAETACVLNG